MLETVVLSCFSGIPRFCNFCRVWLFSEVPGHLALLDRVLEVLAGTAPSFSQICGMFPRYFQNSRALRLGFPERQTARQTDRQTDRQTERQTDREADRQHTDRQTDRETDTGVWSLEPGVWSLEPRASCLEPRAWSLEPGA